MPTPLDAMIGLLVLAIGLLTLVVAFSVAERKKRLIAYVISGLIILLGGYYYVSSEIRGVKMRRRISGIQRQQRMNVGEIQERLEKSRKTAQTQPPKKQ